MTAVFANFVLIICVCDCFGSLDGKQLHPGNQPQQWQELVTFVFQKIEGMERLLAEKDERVDQLEAQMASYQAAILQKDIIINRLATRVSDLETIVMLNPITEKHETRHYATSHIDLPTSNVDITDQFRSPTNNTASLRKTVRSQLPGNEPQETKHNQKTTPYSRSGGQKMVDSKRRAMETYSFRQTDKNEEADNIPVARFSRSRQNRVAPSSAVAFHTALSGNRSYKTGAIILYDHETLDHGSGYSPSDGLYIVPESGTYVLTWTILGRSHQEFNTLLVVNGADRGGSFSDSSADGDYHQSTAVIILTLNQGDHVFIRMGLTQLAEGSIISSVTRYGFSTFSGWKLD